MLRIMVLNYKRPDNVNKIIAAYKDKFPITVINNNPSNPFPVMGGTIDVINNDTNYKCMERWIRCYEYNEPYKLVLDDDLLPSIDTIKTMYKKNKPMIGVYGKSGVSSSNSYSDLNDHWCTDSIVDFLVGSVVLIKQAALDLVKKDLLAIGYPERGDDIIVSYLVKNKCKINNLSTVSGKVLNLPEGAVGLNKDPSHFIKRWNVLQNFKNIGWTDSKNALS
tara:strand:+ start:4221 stop:4883 length:663 start_codon:yes stop_codon:yes gene_type:complete